MDKSDLSSICENVCLAMQMLQFTQATQLTHAHCAPVSVAEFLYKFSSTVSHESQ